MSITIKINNNRYNNNTTGCSQEGKKTKKVNIVPNINMQTEQTKQLWYTLIQLFLVVK